MHIVIAVITAIAGLLWAFNTLQRSGFDLNSLNPYYWARRKRWEQKQVNPLYAIESPRELAALLMFAVMRQAGDPTAEQKSHLLSLYESELNFGGKESTEMYSLASYLLNTDPNYMHKVRDLVHPCLNEMADDQKTSIPKLVREIANYSGTPTQIQTDFLVSINTALGVISNE